MSTDEVKTVFEKDVYNRIIKSDGVVCDILDTKARVDEWINQGHKIVFTAGVFDIFTVNHLLALYHYKLLGGQKTKLVVSVDTDERVARSKSFNPNKGNSIKPVLSWDSRVLMIAKQAFGANDYAVDLILRHGGDTCNGVSCSHDDNVSIAEALQPDTTVVTSTSTATIDALKASPLINNESILVIDEDELAYNDALLGEKISNTAIINRVRSNG